MTKRELRLLAALGVTCVLCGASLLYDHLTKKTGQPEAVSQLEETKKATTSMTTAFAGLPLKKDDIYALSAAEQSVQSNPFQPAKEPSAAPPGSARPGDSAAGGAGALQYTGFVSLGETAMAIVNGMEYAIGDTIPQTGDIIRHISSSEVVLFSPSRNAEWTLSYTGDDF